MSTPWPVPSAEILVVMTSSTYAQEDINNCLFAPDKKVLESAALGSWRLAVFLVTRDPHAQRLFIDRGKFQPALGGAGPVGRGRGLGRGTLLPCYRN